MLQSCELERKHCDVTSVYCDDTVYQQSTAAGKAVPVRTERVDT